MERIQLSTPGSLGATKALPLAAVPFMAMPFLKRTALGVVVTALLTASAMVRVDPAWSARYLEAAAWATVFFAMTPLIIKHLVFNGNKAIGFGLLAGKLVWMGVMIVLLFSWQGEAAGQLSKASALLGGILTPLVVLGLRVIGFYLVYASTIGAARNPAGRPMTSSQEAGR